MRKQKHKVYFLHQGDFCNLVREIKYTQVTTIHSSLCLGSGELYNEALKSSEKMLHLGIREDFSGERGCELGHKDKQKFCRWLSWREGEFPKHKDLSNHINTFVEVGKGKSYFTNRK